MSLRIFVSSTSENLEIHRSIADELMQRFHATYLDTCLSQPVSFYETLLREVDNCSIFFGIFVMRIGKSLMMQDHLMEQAYLKQTKPQYQQTFILDLLSDSPNIRENYAWSSYSKFIQYIKAQFNPAIRLCVQSIHAMQQISTLLAKIVTDTLSKYLGSKPQESEQVIENHCQAFSNLSYWNLNQDEDINEYVEPKDYLQSYYRILYFIDDVFTYDASSRPLETIWNCKRDWIKSATNKRLNLNYAERLKQILNSIVHETQILYQAIITSMEFVSKLRSASKAMLLNQAR